MKGLKLPALLPLLLLVTVHAGASATAESAGSVRSVVDTGHVGAILGLAYDDARGMLFSSGADGTLRIWDAASGALQKVLEITQLDTERIAANPRSPRVAVVVTDTSGAYFLSVWDWEAERELYRIRLDEDPLFMRFSGQGTYLLYGESSWQGLHIIRSEDGTPVEFHPEGFGIVGYAEMSRSEKTLMTYLVSGRIIYWDMATGARTLDVPSVPFLSGMKISRDQRYLAGSSGTEAVVVDAVTGAARARFALLGILSLDFAPGSDALSCATAQNGLVTLSFTGDALAPAAVQPQPSLSPTLLAYGRDGLYLGDASGALAEVYPGGAVTRLTDNQLAGVSGFDRAPGVIALASRAWIRVFQSDFLTGTAAPSFMRTSVVANPFGAPTSVICLPNDRLLAWRTDSAGPGIALIEPSGDSYSARSLLTGFRAPLSDLRIAGNLALGVETGGTIRLTETATGLSLFDVRIPGAATAAMSSTTEIVAGRTASSPAYGSLIRVNVRTGETVAVPDRNAFTYGITLVPGATPPAFYTVGVDPSSSTSLLRHDGPGLDRVTVVDSVGEEDLNVSVATDASTGRFYATLGVDRLIAGTGDAVQTLPRENMAPRRLAAGDGLLFALTRAGAVAVANGSTGALLAKVYLFNDGEWCVLFRDGRYAASPGGDIHVRVFVDGAPVKATEDFRLRVGAP